MASVLVVLLIGAIVVSGGLFRGFAINSDGHLHTHTGPQIYFGTVLGGPASDFTLTDQRGEMVSLEDLRGGPVILTFMDTRCTNTCPLTALEFRTLHAALGEKSDDVSFVGINVNKDYNSIDDAQAFTVRYGLTEISNWYLMTGTKEKLAAVWSDYNIQVEPIPGSDEYSHTPGDYIIDSVGDLRWYVSVPLVEELLIDDWSGPRLRDVLQQRLSELFSEES